VAGQTWEMLETAKFWNRKPSELGICAPDEDVYYMTAYMLSFYDIKAVEEFQMEKEIERRNSSNGRK
jgi:hypothetical protein